MIVMIKKQQGSALAIGLVLLAAITMISVTALQRSGIQGRMIANQQHNELGFQLAQSELDEVYRFYSTQVSPSQALSEPMSKCVTVDDTTTCSPVSTGHNDDDEEIYPSNYSSKLTVDTNVQHTNQVDTMVPGFSTGSFAVYHFVINSNASTNPTSGAPRQLSSQTLGISFIGPAKQGGVI